MNISKDKKNLIIKVPLKQKIYNPYDEEEKGELDNICGVIAGDEEGFAYLIDRSYKGKEPDISSIFLHYTGDIKELCKKLKIFCYEYPICDECHKPIYGTITYYKDKELCDSCDRKKDVGKCCG